MHVSAESSRVCFHYFSARVRHFNTFHAVNTPLWGFRIQPAGGQLNGLLFVRILFPGEIYYFQVVFCRWKASELHRWEDSGMGVLSRRCRQTIAARSLKAFQISVPVKISFHFSGSFVSFRSAYPRFEIMHARTWNCLSRFREDSNLYAEKTTWVSCASNAQRFYINLT